MKSPFQIMTVAQVCRAVDQGKQVYADSFSYRVVKAANGEYYIVSGNHKVGLTWEDGKTMNASKFHIYEPKKAEVNQDIV
jgi:hypothetical protein